MIDRIKLQLSKLENISGYKIVEKKVESQEFFFIRKELDMDRVKDVNKFMVTVYRDFEEGGVRYRGSSTAAIHPTMDSQEIMEALKDAVFSAGFVKNQYYPIAEPSSEAPAKAANFAPIHEWLPALSGAIFKPDVYEKGWVNSAELFMNNEYTRIVNSEGVDVSYKGFRGEMEFIINWKELSEEVELFKLVSFSGYVPDMVSGRVEDMLSMSREKAMSKPTPALNRHTVLLTGEPVKEFFQYYYVQSEARGVYNGISTAKVGENIQGNDVKGDLVNIRLDPALENSTKSNPYDEDGHLLKNVDIFKDGVLLRYWGDIRHSHYLNIEPTGVISNMIVGGGSKSRQALKNEPYLELVAFSDFQMDAMTGNFAGEIRLGWYFDGRTTIPVSGGSISGNIKDIQKEMYFSKELQQENNFLGPETIQLFNVSVVGAE